MVLMGDMRRRHAVGWVTGISEVSVTYMEVWGCGGRRQGQRGGRKVLMGEMHRACTVG